MTRLSSPPLALGLINAFFEDIFVLIGNQNYSKRGGATEGERERDFIRWFTPKMVATSKAGPVESQALGVPSRSPMWLPTAAFPIH